MSVNDVDVRGYNSDLRRCNRVRFGEVIIRFLKNKKITARCKVRLINYLI